MARKRPNPLDDPPAASSSEEEDEDEELLEQHEEDKRPTDVSESEEEVGDEDHEDEEEVDEEEAEKEKIRPPHKPVSKIPNPQSDEVDESDTESESAGFALRPHTSTPASAAKPRTPLKRPVEGEKESTSKAKKKAKPDIGGGGEDGVSEKKSGIIRLWSEEDEIAVLKGMIEFHEKKGVDPTSDSTAFHEFVKKSISFDVSKSQLMEKVRRLKTKYRYNAEKGADDTVFSRPHERKAFELSKTIWGSVGGNVVKNASIKKNSSADHNSNFDVVMALPNPNFTALNTISRQEPQHSEVVVEQGKFSDLYPFLDMSLKSSCLAMMSRDLAETMERCLVSMDKSKLQELDKEWKKQILDEAQVSVRRSELLQKQLRLLLSDWPSIRG